MMHSPSSLTVEELAAEWKCPPRYILHLCEWGKLVPAICLGDQVLALWSKGSGPHPVEDGTVEFDGEVVYRDIRMPFKVLFVYSFSMQRKRFDAHGNATLRLDEAALTGQPRSCRNGWYSVERSEGSPMEINCSELLIVQRERERWERSLTPESVVEVAGSERDHLEMTIAALVEVYAGVKGSGRYLRGANINRSAVIEDILMHLDRSGFEGRGLGRSSLDKRIESGLRMLNEDRSKRGD